MRLVCISDTHGLHRQIPAVPDGDVLIHAGDSLGQGTLENLADLNDWLGTLPHQHKIVIAGNHDWVFQEAPALARETLTNAIYLEDSGTELDGLRFWGSPWTPQFLNWAFMLKRGQALREKWQLIPKNTDLLITHGPPRGIGDQVSVDFRTREVGCVDLEQRLEQLPNLQAHVFGHIHEGYGQYLRGQTRLINASTCTARYEPTNPPIVFDLSKTGDYR
ncbi:metallophosphatase domain-containing protein [Marinobacter bryozoorum]|uniref:metallophosphatase domain-containing protein n=1 Tax=Marinobacter bryozoorum TaxID=256324 RepID=UPI00200473BA|nr:metallophosphatase domain-containing protein [Marinobacter bryozoorum]MCK7546244.1 metallophosphatase domain-containing protein [Marinobacter bryozoorum]